MTQLRNAAVGVLIAAALSGAAVRAAEPRPESAEGLKSLCSDILAAYKAGDQAKAAALVKDLPLPDPDAWFKKVFGDDAGSRGAAEYGRVAPSMEKELGGFFASLVKSGRTEIVKVTRVTAENADAEATGLQKTALGLMKQPTALYSVTFAEPGKSAGTTLWSFVYADGGFRLAGKMRSLKAK